MAIVHPAKYITAMRHPRLSSKLNPGRIQPKDWPQPADTMHRSLPGFQGCVLAR